MQIIRSIPELKTLIRLKKETQKIAFIPTMGSLHEGHLSLIRKAKNNHTTTVCSIFVNPTQFNDARDFELYPRDLTADIQLLENEICDILFLPEVQDIYPDPEDKKQYELGQLEHVFEGAFRPGHFQGVCMVVDKLLQLVAPHELYLGKKDFQQCQVIEKLLELTGQQENIRLIRADTVRESNGLAMSSRNKRLSTQAIEKASMIYALMQLAGTSIRSKENIQDTLILCRKKLLQNGFESVDYFDLVHQADLAVVTAVQPAEKYQLLVAAYIEGVRLIDNLEI